MTSKKKILVLCPHPEGFAPGQRLKYEQYFDYFEKNGYEITVSPFRVERFERIVYKKGHILKKIIYTILGYFIRAYDIVRLPFYDGAYVFLYVTPFGTIFFEFLMRIAAKKYIYDIDDMVFLTPKSKINPYISLFKGKGKMKYLSKHADHVITCTPTLDEFAQKYNKNTTDISSTINTSTYRPVNLYTNKKKIVLGWSGSFSTSKYLFLLEEVLKNLNQTHPFILKVIGDQDFHIEGLEVDAIPWKRESEVLDLQEIDIGLYPLPNDPWVYGKSSLKALQYMALGIPPVATAIGTTYRVIEDTKSGFLVNSESDWLEKLKLLIDNPDLRRDMGGEARIRVVELYSVSANAPTYLSIFRSVYE